MDDRKPFIIYISSDEEEDSGETNVAAGCRGGGGGSLDDSDDDDCVILEEDPDKPVKVVNEKGSDDSDDLLVVKEKGQVACRDYPHPRHLCAKFPFATTPHESHCDKCHCYVCDTLAPCLYWGKDYALSHCNATDKIEVWRTHRENRKKSDQKVEPLVSCVTDAAVSIGSPLLNQAPPLPQPVSNPVTQNQVPIEGHEGTLPACSLSRSHEIPNIALQQGHHDQPVNRQNADRRALSLVNHQNCSPRHLLHQKTNSFSPRPVSTPEHIVPELNNLNLGPANTNPPHVLESGILNQLKPFSARNSSVSHPTNLSNKNNQPNSSGNYTVPVTIRYTGINSQTPSNPRPRLLRKKKGKKGGHEVLGNGQSI